MLKRTPLYEKHLEAGGKIVDFAGWELPINYGSQINEHHFVRQDAGMFDVSHMGVLDIRGGEATAFLRYALANDVAKLKAPGSAIYTCMLNHKGGIIDDLIVYWVEQDWYRIVLNASRREVDFNWLQDVARDFAVTLTLRPEMSIIAVQGPNATEKVMQVLGGEWAQTINALKPFRLALRDEMQVARTGYTGEDGVEIILPETQAPALWQQLVDSGVKPCGLGARDTLRLEAGLNLYGNDMDETITPAEANLSWTVALKDEARDFVGKAEIMNQKPARKLVGVVMEARGVLRHDQPVFAEESEIGTITSGGFSPTLECAVAFVRLPADYTGDLNIDRRGTRIPVRIVKLPFVRNGKKMFV